MNSYFNSWRRKLGAVVLLMACLLLLLWLRRPLNTDFVQVDLGYWEMTLASNQNGLWLVTSDLPGDFYQPGIHWNKHENWALPGRRFRFSDDPFIHLSQWAWATERRWDFFGFHRGCYDDNNLIRGIRLQFTIIPHEAVTIPLTLLAAGLLIWPPRRVARKTSDSQLRQSNHAVVTSLS